MPLNTVGLNALESDDVSHGTAIMNSLRIIAGAMGTAVSVTILSIVAVYSFTLDNVKNETNTRSNCTWYRCCIYFTTVLIIIGFILALFIKEEKIINYSKTV